MNRNKEDERITDGVPLHIFTLKALAEPRHTSDPKNAIDSFSLDDFKDLGFTKPNIDTLIKVFDSFGKQDPVQLRSCLLEWHFFLN